MGRAELLSARHAPGRLGYRVTITDPEFPFQVHIIGLDTAWLCGDDHDAGKLLLTEGQIGLRARDAAGACLPGFRLALAHHPLSELRDGAGYLRRLAETADLLLHGHQHGAMVETLIDPDRTFRVLAAGSFYEGDHCDRWPNGFQVVDAILDDAGRPLRYEIEFWG